MARLKGKPRQSKTRNLSASSRYWLSNQTRHAPVLNYHNNHSTMCFCGLQWPVTVTDSSPHPQSLARFCHRAETQEVLAEERNEQLSRLLLVMSWCLFWATTGSAPDSTCLSGSQGTQSHPRSCLMRRNGAERTSYLPMLRTAKTKLPHSLPGARVIYHVWWKTELSVSLGLTVSSSRRLFQTLSSRSPHCG